MTSISMLSFRTVEHSETTCREHLFDFRDIFTNCAPFVERFAATIKLCLFITESCEAIFSYRL